MRFSAEKVINALRRGAKELPDLRIGQLIVNSLDPKHGGDPFYITNEELARLINNYVNNHMQKKSEG